MSDYMFYEIKNFKRNYECTNIRFIKIEDGSKPPANFSPCDED